MAVLECVGTADLPLYDFEAQNRSIAASGTVALKGQRHGFQGDAC